MKNVGRKSRAVIRLILTVEHLDDDRLNSPQVFRILFFEEGDRSDIFPIGSIPDEENFHKGSESVYDQFARRRRARAGEYIHAPSGQLIPHVSRLVCIIADKVIFAEIFIIQNCLLDKIIVLTLQKYFGVVDAAPDKAG